MFDIVAGLLQLIIAMMASSSVDKAAVKMEEPTVHDHKDCATPTPVVSIDPHSEYGNSDDDSESRFNKSEFNPLKMENRQENVAVLPTVVMSSSINKDFAINHVKEEFPTLHVAPEGVSSNSIVDDSKYKADTDDEEEGNYDQQPKDGQANEPKIKEEPTFEELQMRQIKNQRKYGDRVLLARQSKNGMLKLGGGNVKSYMWPRDLEEQSSRMNGRYCIAYNDLINHSAPKWAGQLSACVSWFPLEKRKGVHFDPTSTPISVFVKRTVKESALGWEYCGEYLFLDAPECYDAGHNVSQKSKEPILKDIAASLKDAKWALPSHCRILAVQGFRCVR